MTKSQAYQQFWERFGLTAFEENSVPTGDKAPKFPYLTYQYAVGSINELTGMTASLWYRSTSWKEIDEKAEMIKKVLRGVNIPYDGGAIRLWCGSPSYQRLADDSDDMIKRIYFTLNAEFIEI